MNRTTTFVIYSFTTAENQPEDADEYQGKGKGKEYRRFVSKKLLEIGN